MENILLAFWQPHSFYQNWIHIKISTIYISQNTQEFKSSTTSYSQYAFNKLRLVTKKILVVLQYTILTYEIITPNKVCNKGKLYANGITLLYESSSLVPLFQNKASV